MSLNSMRAAILTIVAFFFIQLGLFPVALTQYPGELPHGLESLVYTMLLVSCVCVSCGLLLVHTIMQARGFFHNLFQLVKNYSS